MIILNPRRNVRGSVGLVRTVFALLTSKWGWTTIGFVLLIGGLIWGLNSHQVAYLQGNQGQYRLITTNGGIVLFQQENTSNYYVMDPGNFTQADINLNPIENGQFSRFNFAASTDTVYVDVYISSTGTTVSYAHPIEKITFYDQNGQNPVTYTTADYSGNPNGRTINNWPQASLLMLVGALCAGIMLFFIVNGRKRQKLAIAAERVAIEARPSPFARELGQSTSGDQVSRQAH